MTKEEIFKEYFGYSDFREGQVELIDSICVQKKYIWYIADIIL